MKKIELLSPAKDADHGIAAVTYGADAVYIGASRFGARSAATNTVSDIERLVSFAHLYRAKVYVALNTLLFDGELAESYALARDMWNAGADALIVQDMALAAADLPPIPLFASTQTHNDTAEKVLFLERAGFSRVILARELSLEQISEIRAHTSVELESFVHGALCVSYSGQCYMSCCIGGRSGNRGQCAQPCRKKYDLLDSGGNTLIKGKYLLCLKDMNRTNSIRQMMDAGISSFKIEGRLKDISYVKNVTAHYRRAIDAALSGGERRSSSGTTVFDFAPDPSKSFNRGFTEYFLHGRTERISSHDSPKPRGELIGSVVSASGKDLFVRSRAEIIPGDGLCFFDREGGLCGGNVNAVSAGRLTLHEVSDAKPGSPLYRNRDHCFEKALGSSRCVRRIHLSLSIGCSAGSTKLSVSAVDEDGVSVTFATGQEFVPAKNREQAHKTIVEQLSKTGASSFHVDSVVVSGEPFFLPVSSLNEIRRTVFAELERERMNLYKREIRRAADPSAVYPAKELMFEGNVTNALAEKFYRSHGAVVKERGAETLQSLKGRRIMTTKYCLRHELGGCRKYPVQGILSGKDAGGLSLVSDDGTFRAEFNCARCVMELYQEE